MSFGLGWWCRVGGEWCLKTIRPCCECLVILWGSGMPFGMTGTWRCLALTFTLQVKQWMEGCILHILNLIYVTRFLNVCDMLWSKSFKFMVYDPKENPSETNLWDYAWKPGLVTNQPTDPLQEGTQLEPPRIQWLELKNDGFASDELPFWVKILRLQNPFGTSERWSTRTPQK